MQAQPSRGCEIAPAGSPEVGFELRNIVGTQEFFEEEARRWRRTRWWAEIPYLLNGWIQLFFNLALMSSCFYLLYCFYSTISADIESKVRIFSFGVMDQIAKCTREYENNRCEKGARVPALEGVCRTWELCMSQDPQLVARRSQLSADTLGEALNAFFARLNLATVSVLAVLLFGLVFVYNVACRLFARRQSGFVYMSEGAHWPPGRIHYQ